MPHIRIRGMTLEQTQQLSQGLNEALADIIKTSADNFTVECISSQYVHNGTLSQGYPFIEILWFARSQEIKNQCATLITNRVKQLMGPTTDVAVVFIPLDKSDYFENGTHFGS